jgi:hypothetical protein
MALLIHKMKKKYFITIGKKKKKTPMFSREKYWPIKIATLFLSGEKHGILYILVSLSRLDESKHKITINPMKILVYIKFYYYYYYI